MFRVWRLRGIKESTAAGYRHWLRRFLADCARRGCNPDEALYWEAVDRFAERYAHERGIDRMVCRGSARSALWAWSWGLAACGAFVPAWTPPPSPRALRPILAEFAEHRRALRGIVASSVAREIDHLEFFFRFLRSHRRPVTRVRLVDVDSYVMKLRERLSRRTVARVCAVIRAYLRFLHVTGRLRHDIASSVAAPRYRGCERPPRALPWDDVRAIIRAVDRRSPVGLRDHALLLTMAVYGLGSAEARALELEDVDWTFGTLRIRRPKTGQEVLLPLLPAVARSLALYVRRGRPRSGTRALFIKMRAPHGALGSSSAIRCVLVKHARRAGVEATFLGSHALRHSHASRQIDLGASQKIVGDILGHRSPSSTSAYVRVAQRRLSKLALPVPR